MGVRERRVDRLLYLELEERDVYETVNGFINEQPKYPLYERTIMEACAIELRCFEKKSQT